MITSKIESGVLILSIDRQDKKNALTNAMYLDLAKQISDAQSNDAVRTILIRGEGNDFCAGNDLADFLKLAESGGLEKGLSNFPPIHLLHVVVDNKLPLIASVQGAAIGIGLTLLLHCDMVLCAENVRLQAPFVDLGLVPEGGSSTLLPQRVGKANAAEILLLGAPISADRALQMGLCNAVCSLADLDTQASALASAFAAKPQESLAVSKALLAEDIDALHQRIDQEGAQFLERLQSDEAKQALAGFFRK